MESVGFIVFTFNIKAGGGPVDYQSGVIYPVCRVKLAAGMHCPPRVRGS